MEDVGWDVTELERNKCTRSEHYKALIDSGRAIRGTDPTSGAIVVMTISVIGGAVSESS